MHSVNRKNGLIDLMVIMLNLSRNSQPIGLLGSILENNDLVQDP
jgi:hypothetical protein